MVNNFWCRQHQQNSKIPGKYQKRVQCTQILRFGLVKIEIMVNGRPYRTMPSRFGIPLVRKPKPSSSDHPQSQTPSIDQMHPSVLPSAVVTHRPDARSNLDEMSTSMTSST